MKEYIKPSIQCNSFIQFESVLADSSGDEGNEDNQKEKCLAGNNRKKKTNDCYKHCSLINNCDRPG